MFTPSAADVRRFFCGVYAKSLHGHPMEALELLACEWIQRHPEYHATLADVDSALLALSEVPSADSQNAFLHLSLHLSISEQCSIDQPAGIRQAVELLSARRGSLHDAHHEVMACLEEMLWQSQRHGHPPDGHAYIDAVRRRATRD